MDTTIHGGERPVVCMTRRRFLRAASAGTGTLALAATPGCAGKKSAGGRAAGARSAAGTPAPRRGGTLDRAQAQRLDASLDPHPLQPIYTSFYTLFYQTLLRLNPRTAAIEPELAARWEQPSQTEYVLHLQPNVKWQNKPPANGRAMTAGDVVFSLNRVRTDDPRFQNRLLLGSVDQIQAVDSVTVRLTTKAPDVAILTNLAGFSVAVLAPEVVDNAGKFGTAETAVGTGAFILTEIQDTAATVTRNPDYWKPGLPYIDGVRTHVFVDRESGYAAFLAGKVQVGGSILPGPEARKAFEEQQGKSYAAEWAKDVSVTTIQPNVQRKPFDDPRVAKALRLLIDHDEAVNSWGANWFGRGYLTAYLSAALDEWDLSEQEYRQFLEFKQPKDDAVKEAISLLSAAGYSKDRPLKFAIAGQNGGFSQAWTENLQAQFNRLGQGAVQTPTLQLSEQAVLNQVAAQGNFDFIITGATPAQPYDVDSVFTTLHHTGAGRNYGKFSDPKLDQMIDKQRAIFDVDQRKAAVKDILRYMMDNSPYTAWAGRYALNLESRKVHNWAPESQAASWGYNYEQVWME